MIAVLIIVGIVIAIALYVVICRSFWLSRILAGIGALVGTIPIIMALFGNESYIPITFACLPISGVFAMSYYFVWEWSDTGYEWGLVDKPNEYDVTIKGNKITVSKSQEYNGVFGYIWYIVAPYVSPIFVVGLAFILMLIVGLIFETIGLVVFFIIADLVIIASLIYNIVEDGSGQDDNPIDKFFSKLFKY